MTYNRLDILTSLQTPRTPLLCTQTYRLSVSVEYPTSSSPTIRAEDGRAVAQWMLSGENQIVSLADFLWVRRFIVLALSLFKLFVKRKLILEKQTNSQ